MIKDIDVHEARSLIEKNKVTLIDVREVEEFNEVYIEGAQLAPLSNLIIKINDCKIEKNKPVLLYCLKGGRSQRAGEFLSENLLQSHEVINMDGGIKAWIEAGYAVTQPS